MILTGIKINPIGVVLVSLLLTLNIFHTLFYFFFVNFEHVNVGWDRINFPEELDEV